MHRRQALGLLAATVALSPGEILALGRRAHAQRTASAGLRALDADTEQLLALVTEIILPGAFEASVPRFIDVMLTDWYAPDKRERFLLGIQTLGDRKFHDATPETRTAILRELDEATNGSNEDHWFVMLKFLTIWGYFTSEIGERAIQNQAPSRRYQGCVKQ